MLKRTWLFLFLAGWTQVLGAATLKPADTDCFFVIPERPSTLRWGVESGEPEGPLEYTIRDYGDKPVASGRAKLTAEGAVEVAVRLPAGFYDVEWSATGRRFGVVSLPPYQGEIDPFFCIDSALSWLVRGDAVREGLIKALRRSGVAMSRERLAWAHVNPAKGSWDWEGPLGYETVRRLHRKHGVEVLEMFHSTTPWAGQVGKYPKDLIGLARAWRQIGRRWRPTWGALEVWNEPDIFFGANLPADQYVPLVKTLAYALGRDPGRVPLVGGVFAHYNRPFLDNAARNGMLDCVDAASFHTYGRAPEMEALIGNYRAWLKAHGREAMPLWITECGRPWARGPDRPPADQDAASALDVTMKAVESRACGIARYFCFVYPFFEENRNNFGMMGRRATPLRSMAAYAQLARALAHKRYLGDLRCEEGMIRRARVFGDDRETVAILYTGRPAPGAQARIGLPVLRAEGIDGRTLAVAEDGTVPVPDGLSYVWLDRERLGDRLRTDTPAARLWSIGRRPPPPRPLPSPIVLRFEADAKVLESKTEGHRLRAAPPGELPIAVRVFNLAGQPHELTLKLSFSQEAARVVDSETRPVTVPAEGFVDVVWRTDFGGALAAKGRVTATVTAAGEPAGKITPLVFDLAGGANAQ